MRECSPFHPHSTSSPPPPPPHTLFTQVTCGSRTIVGPGPGSIPKQEQKCKNKPRNKLFQPLEPPARVYSPSFRVPKRRRGGLPTGIRIVLPSIFPCSPFIWRSQQFLSNQSLSFRSRAHARGSHRKPPCSERVSLLTRVLFVFLFPPPPRVATLNQMRASNERVGIISFYEHTNSNRELSPLSAVCLLWTGKERGFVTPAPPPPSPKPSPLQYALASPAIHPPPPPHTHPSPFY